MSFNPPGGSGGIAGATDVTLNSPQSDQVLTYDDGAAKWQNQDPTGQVTSVNGDQGTVVLDASDVGAVAAASPGMQLMYGTLANRPAAGQEGRFYIVIPD